MIELLNLKVGYSGRMVVDVSKFHFGTGVSALVGRNGCGKSTLLRVIAGVLPPQTGRIVFDPTIADKTSGRPALGYVPHRPALFPALTVRENLAFWRRIDGVTDEQMGSTIGALKPWFDLEPLMSLKAGSLSRGQQQVVSIVRGLAKPAPILLVDEPYTGLDLHAQEALTHLLLDRACGNCVVILAIHDLELAATISDKVVVLNETRLVRYSSVEFRQLQPHSVLPVRVAALQEHA